MRRSAIVTLSATMLLAMLCGLSVGHAADESQEPQLKYVVTVGNQSVSVLEGETANVSGTFTNPNITLRADAVRVFPYQGISFQYPRFFTFEADVADPDYKGWTLSGTNLEIMYFVFGGRVTTHEYAQNVIEQFGADQCKVSNPNAEITFGEHTLSGTSLHVTVAGHNMTMDVYAVPSGGSQTKLLVLQDSLDEAGNHSSEAINTLDLLKASFNVSK